jgi:sirohydrochlorin ferrochelatase
MRVHDPVSRAYRTTFGEYASKLDALQRLLESKGSDNGRVEAAMQDVEAARQAYHSAREVLACELGIESVCTAAAASR